MAGTHCASRFKNHRLSTSARTRTVTTRNHNLHSGGGSPRRFGPVRQMYPMHQHAFVREAGPLCPPLTCSSHVLPIAWKVPGKYLETAWKLPANGLHAIEHPSYRAADTWTLQSLIACESSLWVSAGENPCARFPL